MIETFWKFFTNFFGKTNKSMYLVPTHIIIHHSFTEDRKTVDWKAIRDYHVQTNKWSDIGYHFGIETILDGYLATLLGRPLWRPGAHEPKMNNSSVGICIIGNFDVISPTTAQYDMCADLCAWLCHIYAIPVDNIHPHSKYAPKTCPGKLFDMNLLREKTKNILLTRWV